MTHVLRVVEADDDWATWHRIRERVLWEARGEFGVYDREHPSLRAGNHFPFLLLNDGVAVGAIALEVEGDVAWLRRVAIDEQHQRLGHGRAMIELVLREARERACAVASSNVAADAVGFYEKLGFSTTSHHPGAGPEMSRPI
jgi:ribosomal protein S18 acetylase RimI-like enzyme